MPLREAARRGGDTSTTIASNERAAQLLGWHPEHGLTEMVADAWQFAITTLLHERGTLGFALSATLDVPGRKLSAMPKGRNVPDPVLETLEKSGTGTTTRTGGKLTFPARHHTDQIPTVSICS